MKKIANRLNYVRVDELVKFEEKWRDCIKKLELYNYNELVNLLALTLVKKNNMNLENAKKLCRDLKKYRRVGFLKYKKGDLIVSILHALNA